MDNLEIQGLEFQIKENSDSAVASLGRLEKALSSLKSATSGGASGLSGASKQLQSFNSALNNMQNNTKSGKLGGVFQALKKTGALVGIRALRVEISKAITESNAYQEDLNLFTASMGKYAKEAQGYAENVGEVMGIDPAKWMRNQGVFNTLLTGFGSVSDRAYLMSKNLTQLGYDISSFFNTSVEDAMQKLQSGISGELEPLRRLGYDLSQAKLEQTALTLGIEKSVSAMTQAEKAELRYYAIMTQVTTAQGDMARSLDAPANQIRIFQAQLTQASRAIGNIFIPILQKILPIAIAVLRIVRELADAIAKLFHFKLTDIDYSGVKNLSSGAGDAAAGLEDATSAAKELKKSVMGFDELNILNGDTASGSGSSGVSGGSGFDFDLPEYDFLGAAVNTQINETTKKLKKMLGVVVAIAAGFLEWKITKSVINGLDALKGLKGKSLKYSLSFAISGVGLFLDAWDKIKEAASDIEKNGVNLTNATKVLSGFSEGLGVAFAALGRLDLSGAMFIISGVSGIISEISDMAKNGVNFENATNLVRNLGVFLGGIGLLTKNKYLTGGGLMLSGITLLVRNLQDVLEAFRTGDWSGVDKVEVAAGVALTIGGALTAFKQIKTVIDASGGATAITETSNALQNVSNSVGGASGGGINSSLKSLAQNLGVGVLVIAEVSAATIIVVGAIWILGEELKKVADAWQPVIDNAGTVAIAVGVGAGLLAVIGLVAYGLGTLGGTAALNIGIGTLILAELGIAAGLFLVEIWAIGRGLDEIGQAWQPVLDNGETIAAGISLGTTLLIGIGVVTAALGVASVASVGILPLAIGLGTAMLVELTAAVIAFIDSLVKVADALSDDLQPALRRLNAHLPVLSKDMSDFTQFMGFFAEQVVDYSKSSAISGFSATVDAIVDFFTKDPIKAMADDANKQYQQAQDLNDKLRLANPELETAISLMGNYYTLLEEIERLTGKTNNISLANGMFVNMKEVGKNLVLGFVDGIKAKYSELSNAIKTVLSESLSTKMADSYGKDFGKRLGSAVASAFRNSYFPSLHGNVNVSRSGSVELKMRAYAAGGFPDEGELFIAREAGAEMVGSIGRKAAVANNDQIVDGISAGVYRAVREAMSGGSKSQPMTVVVQMNGKEMFRQVVNENNAVVRATGASPLVT
jgi:hypothetical protein